MVILTHKHQYPLTALNVDCKKTCQFPEHYVLPCHAFIPVISNLCSTLSYSLDCKDSVNITKQNLTVINPEKYLGDPALGFPRGRPVTLREVFHFRKCI